MLRQLNPDTGEYTCSYRQMCLRRRLWWVAVGILLTLILSLGWLLTQERAARQSIHSKFSMAMQSSEAGFWFWEIPGDRDPVKMYDRDDVVWYSPIFAQNIGVTELPPKLASFLDALHPEDVPRVEDAVRIWYKSKGKTPYDVQYRLKGADGRWHGFQARGSGSFGRDICVLAGSTIPIDESRSNRLRAERILDSSPIALVMCDDTGTITVFNPTAVELFGWSACDLVGKKKVTELMPEKYRDKHTVMLAEAAAKLRESGQPWQITRRDIHAPALKKDGTTFEIEMSARGICYDDRVEFLAFIKDRQAPKIESKPLLPPKQ